MAVLSEEELLNSHLLHRSFVTAPKVVDHASGPYIYFQDGSKVIDASGGAAVTCLGHSNPEILQAMSDQMQKITYAQTGLYNTPAAVELADLLVGDYEDLGLDKVYFSLSGSEVNEAAIKLAVQYFHVLGKHEKTQFISREQSYHGNSLGDMALSGFPARKAPYKGIIPSNFHSVSPANSYRYQKLDETLEQYTQRLADELELKILSVGPERVAAFFLETVVGATAGCVTLPPNYFRKIRLICDKYDVLLVLDEVMCGSGRTGTFFAWEQEGIVPDITTCGKSISGGYAPLAAMFFTSKISNVLLKSPGAAFNSGQTYVSFPLSCAASLAVQKMIRREKLLDNVKEMGEYLMKSLKEKLSNSEIVGDIRGRGLFVAIEFVKDKQTKSALSSYSNFGALVLSKLAEREVAVYPGHGTKDGYEGDHIIISPPFNITKDLVDKIVDAVVLVVEDLATGN